MRVHALVPSRVDASHSELNRLARAYCLDYNEAHPKGEISIVRSRANSLRRCESFVLESALVIRELVGHRHVLHRHSCHTSMNAHGLTF
jgi:hypothetical protein